ncbi:DUF5626 family protein [Atopobium sp. oral taxon 810]|uniref:DUF5626 family protein n=1 Tax=Atopobium sp. oral taxon 810 TaxID=712158 RepID=UPI0003969B16|nr:DUF5626 family protein [Atopobium sp. oral taxon 810]ERI06605.1 hypothetical protein HMPREF9069_00048 [Atopobium sp. oral taxon 810 str. F0209]
MYANKFKLKQTFLSCVIVIIFGVVLFCPLSAQAQEGKVIEQNFSLDIHRPQETVVTLQDGTTGTLGIRPVNESPLLEFSLMSTIPLGNGNGTWEVYWYTGVLNTSYHLKTKNYKITRCYDNYCSGVGIVIDSCTLNWGSKWSQQTTRHHLVTYSVSDTRFLNGNISGHNLVTSVYYG